MRAHKHTYDDERQGWAWWRLSISALAPALLCAIWNVPDGLLRQLLPTLHGHTAFPSARTSIAVVNAKPFSQAEMGVPFFLHTNQSK